MFHRLTNPTYFIPGGGSLPAGYDKINDPADPSVGGSGVPAFADTIKAGGPNDGTYFVAFGEDATSADANRANKALAENADFLDDAINQSFAKPTRGANVVSAGDTSTTLDGSVGGDIWVGESVSIPLDELFVVVDADDKMVLTAAGGVPITVSSIVGAGVGSGWTSVLLTINFSGTIPSGTTYRVIHSRRVNYLTAFEAHLSFGDVQSFAQNDKHIEAALRGGLNERYRRSTTAGAATVNSPGSGAAITRDGQAPSSQATSAQQDYGNAFKDPFWAQWKVEVPGAFAAVSLNGREDGGTGFLAVSGRKYTVAANEKTRPSLPAASFWSVTERSVDVATLSGAATRTRVNPADSTGASLNPDAGVSITDTSTIELATADYFWSAGSGFSEASPGYDIIRIEYTTGPKTGQFEYYQLIDFPAPFNSRRAVLRTLGGGTPQFPSGSTTTGVRFQLLKTVFHQGGGAQSHTNQVFAWSPENKLDTFTYLVPRSATDSASTVEQRPLPATFIAAAIEDDDYYNLGTPLAAPMALVWGGVTQKGTAQFFPGVGLRGDGGVNASILKHGAFGLSFGAVTGTTTWYPNQQGAQLEITFTHVSGTSDRTVALGASYLPAGGEEITVIIKATTVNPPSALTVVTWPASFQFSGTDAVPSLLANTYTKYTGVYSETHSKWFMTKTVY